MEHYDGLLRLAGDFSPPIRVTIDLTEEQELRIATDEIEIGAWPVDELTIRAQDDGFHLLSEGEELVITTDNDPAFAVSMGVRNAPVALRRQMSALMRTDPRFHDSEVEAKISESEV
ncbi:MAG TPA: hypothetical protein VJ815_04635 [Acidimicrobiia bacterium]|nr:hypothetical protein [Acidimicrobiia bacterium]